MKRKLEIRDISGYLSYDLRMYAGKMDGVELIFPVLGLLNDKTILSYENGVDDEYGKIFMGIEQFNFKPILYPEDALYKPMLNNGKEIIPIVELARIAAPEHRWVFKQGIAVVEEKFAFDYDEKANSFKVWSQISDYHVQNQYLLFDKLHEWKIYYRGLIDLGLAVSVYDLDVNPYK